MQDNIRNIQDYLMEQRIKKTKEETNKQNLILARKNGFENYQDYIYSIYKEYSVNPKMPLNKKYYGICKSYLLKTLKTFLEYKKYGKSYSLDLNGNRYDLTVYSLNELINAVYQKDEDIINILDQNNLSIKDFLKLVYTTELVKEDINILGVKRG